MVDQKILIGVSTGEITRHANFYDYFNLLNKPDGTMCIMVHGQSPAKARNVIIEAALEHDCTHVFFIDDDMQLPHDALMKLLAHDLDIVSGYYLMRQYPHQGLVFDKAFEDGRCQWQELKDEDSGLIEVVAAGLGCLLVKTKVFEALEQPWVRLGEIESDGWCDDIGLFKRVREAGFRIHMDLDVICGHMTSLVVAPIRKDGKWNITYDTYGTEKVMFPMVRRALSHSTD